MTMPLAFQRPLASSLAALDTTQPRFYQLGSLWSRQDWWSDFDPSLAWEVKTNKGEAVNPPQVRENRLSTTGGWILMRSSEDPYWVPGQLDWDRIIMFRTEVSYTQHGYFVARSTFGKAHYDNMGPLVDKGIGFESMTTAISRAGIYGVAHDGTTLYRLFFGVPVSSGQKHVLTAISYPDGYVEWLIDDDWRGVVVPPGLTSSAQPQVAGYGPQGAPGADGIFGRNIMQHEIAALEPASVSYIVHNTKLFIDQRTWQ